MADIFRIPTGSANFNPGRVSLRCPHCGREGTFDHVGLNDVSVATTLNGQQGPRWAGVRKCPHRGCNGGVFVVFPTGGGEADLSYPVMRLDFDVTGIPPGIKSCIEELLECHANKCYVAAAILVRRTLELICADKGAKGGDLKARIKDLGGKIVIPQELIEGMDELRVLGNDAAHVEAKAFADIDKPHLDVAIEFTKEILKATYQYSNLLGKLKALKKPSA